MAEKNFRSYRSHDPSMRGGERYAAQTPPDDPLAELARLIGQSNPAEEYAPAGPAGASAYEPEAASDWSADDRYVETSATIEEAYQEDPGPAFDPRYDGRLETQRAARQEFASEPRQDYQPDQYAPPRPADVAAYPPVARDAGYEVPLSHAPRVPSPRMNGMRDGARDYAPEPQLPARHAPTAPSNQPLPAFLPQVAHRHDVQDDHQQDDRYQYDDQDYDGADDHAYESEDYEEDTPKQRRGLVMVAAVLGLVVLGTAGAFAYRTVFGGSMLPSLPPIIKADTGPNKIIPNGGNSQSAAQTGAGGSSEKLVSREEKPVDVPVPVNTAPRVVSTIPVFPAPDSQAPGSMPSMTPGMTSPVMPTPVAPPPSNMSAAPLPTAAAAVPGAPMVAPEPKKIHTVAIRPDQMGGNDAPAAAAQMPPPARVASPPGQPRQVQQAPAVPAAPRPSANAPLSIVPNQGETPAAAPRTRTAVAQPTAISPAPASVAPAPSAGGGYSVQVTSQRSEADAQAAFRSLSAKFPGQLGNQQPIIRRADLGEKGTFYRALVGPYASMEQAAGICSSLKAAGGSCIVQRN